MDKILGSLNEAKKQLEELRKIEDKHFSVITPEDIEDYLLHYTRVIMIHKTMNVSLMAYITTMETK